MPHNLIGNCPIKTPQIYEGRWFLLKIYSRHPHGTRSCLGLLFSFFYGDSTEVNLACLRLHVILKEVKTYKNLKCSIIQDQLYQ